MKNELYLYIHFPFCAKKCRYCDFYSITTLENQKAYFQALNIELQNYSDLIKNSSIKTIYFGGGSPNLMESQLLNSFLNEFKKINSLTNVEEFTVEINPSNISLQKLREFKSLGVNRISIGSQSFMDKELEFLGRIHKSIDIFNTIDDVKTAGIDNFSLDLIFGAPGQSLASWKESLLQAVSTGASHLSFYNLIYEYGTPLTKARDAKKFAMVDEELEFEMFAYAHDFLDEKGFEHYEISNWSLPGNKSRHNSAYWIGKNYLGLGPSAHSFVDGKRWGNLPSVTEYISNLNSNQQIIDFQEILDHQEKIEEALLLGLRTAAGLSIAYFESLVNYEFGKIINSLERKFNHKFLQKYARINKNFLILTVEGWFICDYIIEQILLIIDN